MKPILEIKNVSKQYRIGTRENYLSFRESITRGIKSIFSSSSKPKNSFWALKDVSFSVNAGESIAIIGRNGAGKSTLLKILSRITPPTEGKIISRGRIASLLEVGTGFHAELTGRENIFLNGSILGLKKKEIEQQLDAIIEFSGIEKFIETPLKHYSSGMQLRLAFAVAAHLNPEVLIIDEVLAVGDAEFQKKCMGKMDEVSKSGRTVLFVSHNMEAVMRLCKRGVLLKEGTVICDDEINNAVRAYYGMQQDLMRNHTLEERKDRSGSGKARFINFWFSNAKGEMIQRFQTGDEVNIHVVIEPQKNISPMEYYASCSICDGNGVRMLSLGSGLLDKKITVNGSTEMKWTIPQFPLTADDYLCDLFLFEQDGGVDMADMLEQAFMLPIDEGDFFKTNMIQARGRDKMFTNFSIAWKKI